MGSNHLFSAGTAFIWALLLSPAGKYFYNYVF